MKKESTRRHHYVPRCYLRRFASGKKEKLDVLILNSNGIEKRITQTVNALLVERGMYDLSPFRETFSPDFDGLPDSLLEDTLFAKVHESIYSKNLKESIDHNLCPTSWQANNITGSIWTFYLRTPRIRRINHEIALELEKELDDKKRGFIENFSVITTWSIVKLFSKAFRHTHCTFLNAVGRGRFITSDHPSIPCLIDHSRGQIIRCDEKELQKLVILKDHWPDEVALLCPLSPRWCIISQSIRDLSRITHTSLGTEAVEKINLLIRDTAEKYVIYPPQ